MPENDDVDIEATVKEAKTDYDPVAALQGISRRKSEITLYTDGAAGDELGYAKDVDTRSILGIKTGTERKREGVLGEIDALEALSAGAPTPEQAKKLKVLHKKADALKAQLKATSYRIKLHAVPPIIVKDGRRKAKRDLDIKGKGIPEDKEEEFTDLATAYLLVDTITYYEDVKAGVTLDKITLATAVAMKSFLLPNQYRRLDVALGKLQFKNAIDESVTDQADF